MQRCSEFIALYSIACNQLYHLWISKLLHEIHGFIPYPCWAGARHLLPDASAHFFSAVVVSLFGRKNQIDGFQANKGGDQHHQSLDKPQHERFIPGQPRCAKNSCHRPDCQSKDFSVTFHNCPLRSCLRAFIVTRVASSQHDGTGWQRFRPLTGHPCGPFGSHANSMVGDGHLQCLSTRGIKKDPLMSLHIHGRKAPDTNAAGFPPPPLHGC